MSKTPRRAPAGDVVAGRRPVTELLRAGRRRVHRILVAQGSSLPDDIRVLAQDRNVPIVSVPPDDLAIAAGIDVHQGVVAEAVALPSTRLDAVLDADLLIALDDVADPRNLGAVVRVAEAAGAGAVVVTDRRSAPLSTAALKAAAGAAEWLPVVSVPNLYAALEQAKASGMWVVGLEAGGESPSQCGLLTERVVLVAGSEGGGLRPRVRAACDAFVGIPMLGQVASLNLSTAVAVVAFQAVLRRGGS